MFAGALDAWTALLHFAPASWVSSAQPPSAFRCGDCSRPTLQPLWNGGAQKRKRRRHSYILTPLCPSQPCCYSSEPQLLLPQHFTTMTQPKASPLVLITGTTGHVGFGVLLQALSSNYSVLAAVRSQKKHPASSHTPRSEPSPPGRDYHSSSSPRSAHPTPTTPPRGGWTI